MSAARRTLRGYTMFEMVVVMGALGLLFAAFGRGIVTSAGLSATSRAALMAHDDGRRNLDAIADVLRAADYQTLGGFDVVTGVATAPVFQRALGADALGKVLDVPESLSWRSTPRNIDGVASPGEVIVDRAGVKKVLAKCVPAGGFKVTRQGSLLRITITTYASTSQRRVTLVTGETSVSLRN